MSERSTRAPPGRRMWLASALLRVMACPPVHADGDDATPGVAARWKVDKGVIPLLALADDPP